MQSVTDLKPREGIQGLQIIPLDWTKVSALQKNNAIHPFLYQGKVKTKNAMQSTAEHSEIHMKTCLFDLISHASMSAMLEITG